nr:uncharacterized protein LOC106692775 isoform X2 [Halyomorpha halys]
MFTAFIIAFLALRLLDTPPNLFSSAAEYQNVNDDNILEDQSEDGKSPNRDEYPMRIEDPEAFLSQESAGPEELCLPMMKDNRKMKRWIWSKKSKKEKKNVFNTGATEGARGTVLHEDEHVRNRAAEIYGNQYEKGVNQVSRSSLI